MSQNPRLEPGRPVDELREDMVGAPVGERREREQRLDLGDRLEPRDQVGAVAYAQALLSEGVIGMITTHDLTISQRAQELGVCLKDVHLADEVTDGEWVFDYTLRPGPVTTSNALAWLEAVGMDIV